MFLVCVQSYNAVVALTVASSTPSLKRTKLATHAELAKAKYANLQDPRWARCRIHRPKSEKAEDIAFLTFTKISIPMENIT